MYISKLALLAAQLSSVLAAPTRGSVVRPPFPSLSVAAGASETLPPTPAETGAPAPEEGGEGEAGENEIEQSAEFDVPIVVPGGSKVDTLYPPGQDGVFEVEIQGADDRTLTVTQNTSPAPPPAGFVTLEGSSFIVNLAEGTDGLALQKIDYILNANSTLDISAGTIGRLCTEIGAFVIDPAVGEIEFEAEENELTLTVQDVNAEWAVFIPDTTADGATGGGATGGGCAATDMKQELMDLLLRMLE